MIRLSNTTKKLQAVLGGAVTTSQPQAVVSFFDENNAGEETRGADQETNLNSTTDVDICNALGTGKESYTRNIDTLTIYNRDTVSATVTVKIDDGGTETILVKATLATLETLSYDHESGWRVMTAAGATKMAQASMALDDLTDVTISGVATGDHLVYNGTAWVNVPSITLGTEVASTSGTSIDFTGIPSGVRRITINFVGVSVSGTSNPLVQLGDSGGIENSGYLGAASFLNSDTNAGTSNYTSGFGINSSNASSVIVGTMTLTLENASTNLWSSFFVGGLSSATQTNIGSGTKALSAVLDRVRITTVGGTDTFDAGAINITYER